MLFSPRKVNRKTFRSMLQFSTMTFLNTVAYGIAAQTPVLIIGKIFGAEAVTFFSPAILIASGIAAFVVQISRPLTPLASRDRVTNKGSNLGKWSVYVSQISTCFGLGCLIPFSIYGFEIMNIWIGPDIATWWHIVVIMTFGAILSQTQSANLNLA